MFAAAGRSIAKFWMERGQPAFDAWWNDMGDRPLSHFLSMCFGIAILYGIKFVVWLVA